MPEQKSQVKNPKRAAGGTRQRISACRKRLRQTRARLRALHLERDEAVLAAHELLALAARGADFGDPENEFGAEGGPKLATAARQFAPEVDRRPRLRAR